MKKKDYTAYWIVFLFVALWCFWLIGCSKNNVQVETETFPYTEEEPIKETVIYEDPILEKLIELGEVPTI